VNYRRKTCRFGMQVFDAQKVDPISFKFCSP
jgi:hypothetical protein